MALLFMDSFDGYATADLTEKWTAIGTGNIAPTISANGRTSNSLRWTTVSNGQSMQALTITPSHAPGDATCIVGFAYRSTDVSGGLTDVNQSHTFAIYNGAALKYAFWQNGDGTWSCGDAGSANDYTSSGVPIQDNTWAYLEIKVVIADSGGSVTIRVNGTNVLSETGIDTNNGGASAWTSVKFFSYSQAAPQLSSATIDIDDFYLLDGTTGTGKANNDFWGDTSVKYVAPTSNGTTNEWDRTGGGSANYEAIDDSAPDDDTTYVSTAVVDEVELYNLPDVTAGAYCYGIQVCVSAKKGDTGSAQVAGVVKTTGNPAVEHGSPLGVASDSAYSYFLFPWDANPDSATDWTESDLNALEIGVKKTA